MDQIDLTKLRIEKLSEENLALTKSFDCGDSDLNEFLKEDALKHQSQLIAITYLCFYEETIAAYFTLLSDAIEIKGGDKRVFLKIGMSYKTYPAMKIGRMAADNRFKGYGMGRYIIKLIVSKTISYSKDFGCRYITVDSYPDAVSFYEKMGFIHTIKEETDKTISMRLDLTDIISNKD